MRQWIGWVLPLLLAAPAIATTGPTPLEECILRHSASQSGGNALIAISQARGVCYDIAVDEAQLNLLRVNQRIYANQLMQNTILLTMVVLITITGLVLSALQLLASYKLALAGNGQLGEGGEITVSTSSVAVKSSFVGVLILGISLAFFMIYVTNVYQLRPYRAASGGTNPLAAPAAATAPAAEAPPANMTEVPN